MSNSFSIDLDRNAANFTPLTPLSFLSRASRVFGDRPAYVYGKTKRSWGEVSIRCKQFAAALNQAGIGKVREHMASDNLVVAHPDEDIVDVAQDMLRKNKRRRPVVENGKLIGQITCRQLLHAVKQFRN